MDTLTQLTSFGRILLACLPVYVACGSPPSGPITPPGTDHRTVSPQVPVVANKTVIVDVVQDTLEAEDAHWIVRDDEGRVIAIGRPALWVERNRTIGKRFAIRDWLRLVKPSAAGVAFAACRRCVQKDNRGSTCLRARLAGRSLGISLIY